MGLGHCVSRQVLQLCQWNADFPYSFKLLSVYFGRPCLLSWATCLVSKPAEENLPSFPSCFPYVLQTDINNSLFLQSPKNEDWISMRTMKLQVNSVPLIFPFAKQFHAVAVCLWDLLILVGWSAYNSFCFSSLGDPLHAVCVLHISCSRSSLPVGAGSSLLSSLLLFKALKWSKRRMRSNKPLQHLFWQGWRCSLWVVLWGTCSGRCKVLLLLLW